MNKNKSAFTLIELLIAVAFLFIILGSFLAMVGGRSEGKRIGVITKFSYKGLAFKSYEAEMVMGGLTTASDGNGGSTLAANVWRFSVRNPVVAKKVEELVGKRVMVNYKQSMVAFITDTTYDAISVEEVKPEEPKK